MLNNFLASGVRETVLTLIPDVVRKWFPCTCRKAERGSAPCLRATPAGLTTAARERQKIREQTGAMGGVIRNGVTEEVMGFTLDVGAISLVWLGGLARKSALGHAGSGIEGRDMLSVVRGLSLPCGLKEQ